MNISNQIKRSIKWNIVSVVAKLVSEFGVRIGLALVLTPAAFGIYNLSASLLAIIAIVCGLGIQPALVQRPRDNQTMKINQGSFKLLSLTNFIGMSAVICGSILAIHTQFAAIEVAYSTQILSLSLMLAPFSIMYTASLQRTMRFNHIAKTEIFSHTTFFCVAFLLAYLDYEYLSLVIALLISQISKTVALSFFSKYSVTSLGKICDAFSLLVKSKYFLFGSLIATVRSKSDVLILGIMLGPTTLGVYSLAFAITDSAQIQLASIVNRTMFPAYSKLNNEHSLREVYYLKITKIIASLMLPVYALLLIFSDFLVSYFLSVEWSETAQLIKILSVAGMVYAIGGYPPEYFNAAGRPDISFNISIFNYVLVSLPTLVIFTSIWGAKGTAFSVLTHYITLRVSQYVVLNRIFGIDMSKLISALVPGLIVTLVVFLVNLSFFS